MIDPKDVHRALDSMKPEACKHPSDQIIDLPDRSYCRKCGQDVPPLMRDNAKSAFSVFPSAEDHLKNSAEATRKASEKFLKMLDTMYDA